MPVEEEFYRIKRLPPYVIAEVNAMRAAARASGRDIIDLGMGNPDLPPPAHVIEKLCEVAQKPSAHGYSASKGIPGIRKAQASYYANRFNVELDPETEVVMTMGSRKAWRAWPPRSPRPATWCWRPTRPIPSTPSASSLPGQRSARCRPRPMNAIGNRSTARWPSPCRARRS
jgi:hypothetical protein